MKLSLKIKLTLSYIVLSLFLVIALLIAANDILEKKFQNYIIEMQEKKNLDIVHLVSNAFGDNGEVPSTQVIEHIGNAALSQGLILMVSDDAFNELFCMSDVHAQMCNTMISDMKEKMGSIYPNFNGAYTLRNYDVIKNGQTVGIVTLGYYGPFYYNDEDIQFLEVLNQLFISIGVIFLVIATFLGFFMASRIAKPIKKVIDQTKQIESGNYGNHLKVDSKTEEINQLMHSINTLADTLEKQQASKKRMAKDYAHEFRTPLATLQSNLEAMIDGIWEPTKERLDSCREEILRLTRMVSEIDRIVKIENDSVQLKKITFDLENIVEQVAVTFQPDMKSKEITLRTSNSHCEIYADKDKIIQVMINLLSNAIKYTDNGGMIDVNILQDKSKVELIISDTGIGIESEDLPHIFDHLYRTDKSRNRNTGGSGIGLSVVKAIVEAHSGTICVKSERNKGSQFIVTLPKH